MNSSRGNLFQRATDAVRALGQRPLLLLLTILALNAAARPYRHFVHDARLYGFQVLNRLNDGAYNDDLFFRYGSQDKFSIFSTTVAPIVRVFGIDATFFILFFACNVLLLWSFQRLVRTLIEDRALATAALLLLAVSPLPYGGFNIFRVHEPFLTPRILANALVLFGLERALQRKWTLAFLLPSVGCLVHPLMGIAGLIIVAVYWLGESMGWKKTLIGGGVSLIGGVIVLAVPSLAVQLFGYMDAEWRTVVRQATPYNFPGEWSVENWVNILASFAVMMGALAFMVYDRNERSRFLTVVCGVGIVGLLGTVIACQSPYAILFQGQPYRALWIVKFFEIPLAMWLINRLWAVNANWGYAGLTAFVSRFGIVAGVSPDLWLVVLFLASFVLVYRVAGLSTQRQWLWRSVLGGLSFSFVAWSIYLAVLVFVFRDQLFETMGLLSFICLIGDLFGPLCWLAAGILLIALLRRKLGLHRAYGFVMTCMLLIIQVGFFALQAAPVAGPLQTPNYHDVQFVQNFLQQQRMDRPPVIYSSLGNSKYLWLDWRVVSYFDRNQVSGVLFNRETAVEGARRAKIVRSFEIDRLRIRENHLSDERAERIFALYGADFSCPKPAVIDLVQLLKENVDYVVLKHEFPGLYCATNGRVFIYERRYVTAKLSSASGIALASAAR